MQTGRRKDCLFGAVASIYLTAAVRCGGPGAKAVRGAGGRGGVHV